MTGAFLGQLEALKRQVEREGELPSKKIPPLSREALRQSLSEMRVTNIKLENDHVVRSTYIGMSRTYSTKPLNQLRRVSISDMYIRKIHKDQFLLCRIMTPSTWTVSVMVGVEDPEGFVAQLSIYNYPGMTDALHSDLDVLLPMGTILAIREPSYRYSLFGDNPMIRVDAPSDVVFLPGDSAFISQIVWSSDLKLSPMQLKANPIDEWLSKGRKEFQLKRWLAAAVSFSEGLKSDQAHPALRLNRAQCYLRLKWYNAALKDAEEVRSLGDTLESSLLLKASFRSAKAQYMLGNYIQCIKLLELYTENEECKMLISNAKQRMNEQATGRFDWTYLFNESVKECSRPEVANFTGPIEITKSGKVGGGRGISVTKDIEIGELLVVEKPIASCYDGDLKLNVDITVFDLSTSTTMNRAQLSLIHKVAERLWDDSKLDQTLKSLYSGPSFGSPRAWQGNGPSPQSQTMKHPLEPVSDIDVPHIEAVCTYNSFAPQQFTIFNSLPAFADAGKAKGRSGSGGSPGSVLYGLSSLINHACQPSAYWYTLGDVMVVRTARAMKKGEEVTIPYVNSIHPFAHRSKAVSKWGFVCQCDLCIADRTDGEMACAQRVYREEDFVQPINAGVDIDRAIRRIKSKISDIENTYTKSSKLSSSFILKPGLLFARCWLSVLYQAKAGSDQRRKYYVSLSIEERMRALELGGLIITDKSVSGSIADGGQIPIDTTNSQCHHCSKLIVEALQIAHTFVHFLEDAQRGKAWLNAASWIHHTFTGGDENLFKTMCGKLIEQFGLIDFV